MRMAKARQHEIDYLREFLLKLEEFWEAGIDSDSATKLEELLHEDFARISGWRRIVEGYQALVDNACDPNLNYLDWKPELKERIEGNRDAENLPTDEEMAGILAEDEPGILAAGALVDAGLYKDEVE